MSGLLSPQHPRPRTGASSTRARSAQLAKTQESVAKRESEIIARASKQTKRAAEKAQREAQSEEAARKKCLQHEKDKEIAHTSSVSSVYTPARSGSSTSRVRDVEESPICSEGSFVDIEPDYSPNQNEDGGQAVVLRVHGRGVESTYDVEYTIGRRVENGVPASRIVSPKDLQGYFIGYAEGQRKSSRRGKGKRKLRLSEEQSKDVNEKKRKADESNKLSPLQRSPCFSPPRC